MTEQETLKVAIREYWLKHREAYENHVAGKFANYYQLHDDVRQAGYRVVLAAEKLSQKLGGKADA